MNTFSLQDMLIIAESPTQAAHLWHKIYSLGPTKILGKLACIVSLKILGIGTSERNWNQVKQVKYGKRTKTGNLKYKKQALCFSAYTKIRKRLHHRNLGSDGKLCNDDDL